MLVSNILNEKGSNVVAIPPQATLLDAARVLSTNRIGALLVLTPEGTVSGILSIHDIVRALAEDGAGALTFLVAARMTKNVVTCEATDTIAEIVDTMACCHFGHMPVVENGRVVGIVSSGDAINSRIAETIREAQALKEYIATGLPGSDCGRAA